MRPNPTRDAGLAALGALARLKEIAFDEFGQRRPYDERVRLLEEYKVEVKRLMRAKAHELHPDRNEDLPAAEKREKEVRLQEITVAYEYIQTLKPAPPPAPPPVRLMYSPHRMIIVRGTTGTSTSSATGGGFSFSFDGWMPNK